MSYILGNFNLYSVLNFIRRTIRHDLHRRNHTRLTGVNYKLYSPPFILSKMMIFNITVILCTVGRFGVWEIKVSLCVRWIMYAFLRLQSAGTSALFGALLCPINMPIWEWVRCVALNEGTVSLVHCYFGCGHWERVHICRTNTDIYVKKYLSGSFISYIFLKYCLYTNNPSAQYYNKIYYSKNVTINLILSNEKSQ